MGARQIFANSVFFGLLLLITFLSVAPDVAPTGFIDRVLRKVARVLLGDPNLSDKIAHFTAYATLGLSAYWARIAPFGRLFWAPLALAAYGAALEVVQGIGGVRHADFTDAAANAAGAIAGFAAAQLLMILARRVAR